MKIYSFYSRLINFQRSFIKFGIVSSACMSYNARRVSVSWCTQLYHNNTTVYNRITQPNPNINKLLASKHFLRQQPADQYRPQNSFIHQSVRHYRIDIMEDCISTQEVVENLNDVLANINQVYKDSPTSTRHSSTPRLVAVSKTKPVDLVIAAYDAGQRYFGENYIQELVEKSNNDQVRELCADIKWVFIGTLQSNKINKLLTCPNLNTVETVTSIKHADLLNKAWLQRREQDGTTASLNVFVQVNTSGEKQKGGLEPSDAILCAKHIVDSCPALGMSGFMTIGALAHSLGTQTAGNDGDVNPDFACLRQTRIDYCKLMNITDEHSVELSMGMSADYEEAIRVGATNVRVGSTIFGARRKKPDA